MSGHPSAGAAHLMDVIPQLERRRSQRVTAKLHAALLAKGRLFWARHKALIVDYSILGLKVQAEAALTSGQFVRIIAESNGQSIDCQVVWVGTAGSASEGEAGLAFLDLISR